MRSGTRMRSKVIALRRYARRVAATSGVTRASTAAPQTARVSRARSNVLAADRSARQRVAGAVAKPELRNQKSGPPVRELGFGGRHPSHDGNRLQLGHAIDCVLSTDENTLVRGLSSGINRGDATLTLNMRNLLFGSLLLEQRSAGGNPNWDQLGSWVPAENPTKEQTNWDLTNITSRRASYRRKRGRLRGCVRH